MKPSGERRTVVFALGANEGDRLRSLGRAARGLASALSGVRVSAVFATPPEGGADQQAYFNAVVAGEAALSPREALALAGALEAEAGRARPYPGAPRVLDVDVIFVGDLVVDEEDLRVPHPRWRGRDFVVVPLLDVVPDFRDPESGLEVQDVARRSGWDGARFPKVAEQGGLLAVEAG